GDDDADLVGHDCSLSKRECWLDPADRTRAAASTAHAFTAAHMQAAAPVMLCAPCIRRPCLEHRSIAVRARPRPKQQHGATSPKGSSVVGDTGLEPVTSSV